MSRNAIFLVAGEASGDRLGGALAAELRRLRPGVELVGVGGPYMRDAGVTLLHDYEEFAVLGIAEVIGKLPFFRRILGQFEERFRSDPPGLFIPIDFPDFNMRLAARAHSAGVPVLWYVSPQVWAWRSGRVKTLAKIVDRMVVVFPFEEAIYDKAGLPVSFVGHPLLERPGPVHDAATVRARLGIAAGEKLVALLPGSRRQEIRRILPPLADAGRRLASSGVRAVLSRAPSIDAATFDDALAAAGSPNLPVWSDDTASLVRAADLAVVASGTATLETGLLGTPLIVVYRMAGLSWELARRLVRVEHVGLVNIALGKRVAPELLQGEVTGDDVASLVSGMLRDPERLATIRTELAALPSRLGGPGASERTARLALELLDRRGQA
ncbi:MAG TPA: lipid-A-disaccharide synthase [Candidatus Eisenbacteria bacterium]